jgi:hypothetical protein
MIIVSLNSWTLASGGGRAVRDPVHVRKHLAREPGDPTSACGGENSRPHPEVEGCTLAIKRDAAAGVDGQTWEHYGETLEARIVG